MHMDDRAVDLPFSGAKLRREREVAGFSRPGLSARCAEVGNRISHQHIGRLERGDCMPQAPTLKTLRLALDVDLEALLDAPSADKESAA